VHQLAGRGAIGRVAWPRRAWCLSRGKAGSAAGGPATAARRAGRRACAAPSRAGWPRPPRAVRLACLRACLYAYLIPPFAKQTHDRKESRARRAAGWLGPLRSRCLQTAAAAGTALAQRMIQWSCAAGLAGTRAALWRLLRHIALATALVNAHVHTHNGSLLRAFLGSLFAGHACCILGPSKRPVL
jgi:hypothetical protein